MPSCPDIERLERFAAGFPATADDADTALHVETCSDCRGRVAMLRSNLRVAGRLGAIGPALPPDEAPTRTAQFLDSPVHAPPPRGIPGFTILSFIGGGGQGVVYEALQLATKRTVAIKVLAQGQYASPDLRRRFEREIELAAHLRHPGIVAVHHSALTPDGRQFLVMDLVRGVPLDRHCREKHLPLEDVLELFSRVCDAVQYAHQRGIIHRDLKPGNILVDAEGCPRVLDFGLAKRIGAAGEAPPDTLATLTNQVMGTVPYMSPEQARGQIDEVDTRSDVYTLGVILHRLLTGQYPHVCEGEMSEVLRRIAHDPPTPARTAWKANGGGVARSARASRSERCPIDDEVETIVLRALAKEKERRYQSAGEVARDVRHYLAHEPIEAKRESGLYVLRKMVRRHRVPVAVAGAVVIVLAASAVISTVQWRRAARENAKTRGMSTFLFDVLRSPETFERGDDVKVSQVLDWATQDLTGRFSTEPDVQATLRTAIGHAYRGLGRYEEAYEQMLTAYEMRRKAMGSGVPETRESLLSVVALLRDLGRPQEAEPLLLALLDEAGGDVRDEDPYWISVFEALGRLLQDRGELTEAENWYRRALRGQQSQPDCPRGQLAMSLHHVGAVLVERQKFAEAVPLIEQSLGLFDVSRDPNRRHQIDTMKDLGKVRAGLGDLRGAEEAYQQAMNACEKWLPAGSTRAAEIARARGRTLFELGRYEEAESLLRAAVEYHTAALGEQHVETLLGTHYLSENLLAMGRVTEAQVLIDRALETQDRFPPANPMFGLFGKANRASLLSVLGRHDQAISLSRAVLRERQDMLGDAHTHTLRSGLQVGRTFLAADRPSDAKPFLREAWANADKALGPRHWLAAQIRAAYAQSLAATGQWVQARVEYTLALDAMKESLGTDHPSVRAAVAALQAMEFGDAAPDGSPAGPS